MIIAVRVVLALISAFFISILWNGGHEKAQYGFIQPSEEISGWGNILWHASEKASLGIIQLALIVIPLMIVLQYMKDKNWLQLFSKWIAPIMRILGMNENMSTTMAAGLTIGLAFGAGVMMQAAKEDGVSKKDLYLYLAFIFLVSRHAVVEDTLIFIPLGIPVSPLLLIRLLVAILLTIVVAIIWTKIERKTHMKRKPRSSF